MRVATKYINLTRNFFAAHGVTAWLPATMTATGPDTERALAHVVELVVVGHVAGGDELDARLVEAALAELLQEVLARNPEQMDAHRLLVRCYSSMHDEAKLHSALERLADAAEDSLDAALEEAYLLQRRPAPLAAG